MNPFEQYLTLHKIELVHVCIEAKLRYLIVWNAIKGNPITLASAQKIKGAVFRLTGVPYTDSFTLTQTEPSGKLPPTPLRKIHFKKSGAYHVSRYCRSGTGS